MDRITNHPYVVKVYEWIQNPYVITAIAVIVVVYGSLMAPRLPPRVAHWFDYPVVKMIIIFIIVIVHRFSPIIALLIAVAFLLSIQTLTMYQSKEHPGLMSPEPTYEEQRQIGQELDQEMVQGASHSRDEVSQLNTPVMHNNLHPMNRPTANTTIQDQRVLDPDDPSHPGWKVLQEPNVNTAIYELNPPYAQKGQPETCTSTKPGRVRVNQPTIDLPEGGPTRYSAYHGYKVV
jgi:hypothetical protein